MYDIYRERERESGKEKKYIYIYMDGWMYVCLYINYVYLGIYFCYLLRKNERLYKLIN